MGCASSSAAKGNPRLRSGSEVLIEGLSRSRTELNGQRATALAYVEATGRWTVRLAGDGSLFAVKPGNLRLVRQTHTHTHTHTGVIFDPDLALLAGSFAARLDRSPISLDQIDPRFAGDPLAVAPGATVWIRDLTARPDLNGATGTALAWLPETGRWRVRLDALQETVAVRPDNLVVLQDAQPVY